MVSLTKENYKSFDLEVIEHIAYVMVPLEDVLAEETPIEESEFDPQSVANREYSLNISSGDKELKGYIFIPKWLANLYDTYPHDVFEQDCTSFFRNVANHWKYHPENKPDRGFNGSIIGAVSKAGDKLTFNVERHCDSLSQSDRLLKEFILKNVETQIKKYW